MVRWLVLGVTVAACSAPLAPIVTAPAPDYVLAEPLAPPPIPVPASPFDARRLSALQPIQPVAEAEAIEAPSRIVIASGPAETASLVILARPAEPSPVRVMLVPAPELVRPDPPVRPNPPVRPDPPIRLVPEPAPVVIAEAPAAPVLVRLPTPLYVPASPPLTVFATRPTTWGAACRQGDASACIMAQAVGSNRGI